MSAEGDGELAPHVAELEAVDGRNAKGGDSFLNDVPQAHIVPVIGIATTVLALCEGPKDNPSCLLEFTCLD